jgi:hypothetical protein
VACVKDWFSAETIPKHFQSLPNLEIVVSEETEPDMLHITLIALPVLKTFLLLDKKYTSLPTVIFYTNAVQISLSIYAVNLIAL